MGGDRKSDQFERVRFDLTPDERSWFRRLADHVDIVEECINGIDADGEPCTPKTSRSAILNEISYRLTRDNPPELPEDTFSCIVIDPPWQMGKIEREERPRQDDEIDYATLPVDCGRDGPHSTNPLCCISAIPLKDLAGPDGAHLYLWVTHKYLPAGLELVEHWGFRYQCLMTWRKNVGITPYSWMYDTEHVIFARRGNLDLQQLGLRLSFDAPVAGHSTKPDIFYDRVIAASPEPRLEMFARRSREGFTTWGNET
jgi:N6-adenosine-specific RNA methylase IME4